MQRRPSAIARRLSGQGVAGSFGATRSVAEFLAMSSLGPKQTSPRRRGLVILAPWALLFDGLYPALLPRSLRWLSRNSCRRSRWRFT